VAIIHGLKSNNARRPERGMKITHERGCRKNFKTIVYYYYYYHGYYTTTATTNIGTVYTLLDDSPRKQSCAVVCSECALGGRINQFSRCIICSKFINRTRGV